MYLLPSPGNNTAYKSPQVLKINDIQQSLIGYIIFFAIFAFGLI